MGYVSKDIAVITEPKVITLSALPNFVTFASKASVKTYLEITIKINALPATPLPATVINITEPSGVVYSFQGTLTPGLAKGNIFFVSGTKSDTAENLRQALLNNRWIAANFDITIPFTYAGGTTVNGDTLTIKSKGAGADFNFTLAAPGNTANVAYLITNIHATSTNNDSISGEASTMEIELDVYTDPDVFLGQDDKPTTSAKLGKYATTLQKTYSGVPLWFQLNSFFGQNLKFNIPPTAAGWFNTGTLSVYRFVANLKNYNSFSFYQSSALFVVNGYGTLSDAPSLTPYVYSGPVVKLLTNKPKTNYIKGQREYLNFILQDDQRGLPTPTEFNLSVLYRAYTTSGVYLGAINTHSQGRALFNMVNTCVLDIDAVLTAYPTVGLVKVALSRGGVLASNDLEYTILPAQLHKLQQFTFLNALGGWDAFNFDSTIQDDVKPESDTFNKTVTPSYKRGDSVESVYAVSLENTLTIDSAPFSDKIADWLKELAASKVVLDQNGNYVIKEDFTMRKSSAAFNMQTATIKYRLSETYTND